MQIQIDEEGYAHDVFNVARAGNNRMPLTARQAHWISLFLLGSLSAPDVLIAVLSTITAGLDSRSMKEAAIDEAVTMRLSAGWFFPRGTCTLVVHALGLYQYAQIS